MYKNVKIIFSFKNQGGINLKMSLLFILIGLYTIIATIKKPNFFWENKKAKLMRKIIGDKVTSIFYMAIGFFISVVGIYLTFAG